MSHADREAHRRQDAAKETAEDAELEAKIAQYVRRWKRAAMCLGMALFASIAALVPFLAGHSLHSRWDAVGRYLLLFAMGLLPAFLYAAGTAYNMHLYLRAVKKIDQDYTP